MDEQHIGSRRCGVALQQQKEEEEVLDQRR
jgi:hypothetical protein